MATEELLLVINDAQLKQALTQITMIKNAQIKTTGRLKGLSALVAKTRKDARAAGLNLGDLPTLNRDMRIVGGLFPGFRQASQLLFQVRRGVRAQQLKREAEALRAAGLEPELAAQLGQAALIGQVALVVAAVTTLIRLVDQNKRAIEKTRSDHENLIRRGLGLSHQEFIELDSEQAGFASRFDAFVEKWESDRQLEAIAASVRNILATSPWTGPMIQFDPLASRLSVPGIGAESLGKWFDNVVATVIDAVEKRREEREGAKYALGETSEDVW